jgi:hypothetical protein
MASLEPLDPYSARFRKRFFADAVPWARDNIVWGVVVLIVPPLAAFLRDRSHALIDWVRIKNSLELYGFAFAVYALVYVRLTARRLDADREAREQLLASRIAGCEQTIRGQKDAISTLEKPKRSAGEQHDYDKLKRALQILKGDGLIALRHIRSHRSLTLGSYGASFPVLPPGLTLERALWVYRHCASEGLLIGTSNSAGTQQTFAIDPKTDKLFDELLFTDENQPS